MTNEPKEVGMLFTALMIRAALDGTKTETRRLRARARVGDTIWGKETFYPMPHLNAKAYYRATDPLVGVKWKPSIFMPKALARFRAVCTERRREPLHSITAAGAIAEGIQKATHEGKTVWRNYTSPRVGQFAGFFDLSLWFSDPVESYASLWDSINKPPNQFWNNPTVEVIGWAKV